MGYFIIALILLSIVWPYLIIFAVVALTAKIVYEIFFWVNHQKPLSDDEIRKLSEARRVVYINKIFNFTHMVVGVNPNYRGGLDKEGRWDRISLKLSETLSLLAQLLRYKRHEWSVWVLADDTTSKFLWANKGDDNSSCYFSGSIVQLIYLAIENNCHTVIHMHNHPHTKERTWNLLAPSETDLNTLKETSAEFDKVGLNFIDTLCTQGQFIVYGYSFSPKYFPPKTTVEEIRLENGISEKQNYKLHKELCKIKRKKINPIK